MVVFPGQVVEPKKSKRAQHIVLGLVAVMLCFYAWCAVVAFYVQPSNDYVSKVKFVGQKAVVDNGGDAIILAATQAALDELSKARIAGDKMGIFEVIAGGRAFPVDCKTKVLVLETGFGLTRVRVIEGPHQGKAGWVPFEFVK